MLHSFSRSCLWRFCADYISPRHVHVFLSCHVLRYCTVAWGSSPSVYYTRSRDSFVVRSTLSNSYSAEVCKGGRKTRWPRTESVVLVQGTRNKWSACHNETPLQTILTIKQALCRGANWVRSIECYRGTVPCVRLPLPGHYRQGSMGQGELARRLT